MKIIILLVSGLILLQGCSSLQLNQSSPHGIIVFSTSLISGCDESSYFNNGILFVENKPEAAVSFNIPIGHAGTGEPFTVKNIFYSTDFGKTGIVHAKKFDPGTYYFTQMHATPRPFVHHETEVLGISFNVKPGKIHYIGSIALGTTVCADSRMKPNIGARTIVNITDESARDLKIVQKKWQNMPLNLVEKSLASSK